MNTKPVATAPKDIEIGQAIHSQGPRVAGRVVTAITEMPHGIRFNFGPDASLFLSPNETALVSKSA